MDLERVLILSIVQLTALLLEKWKQSLHKLFGVLLTDLSKALDCLSRELLASKLNVYGVEISSVKLIYGYITNRHLKH